LPNSEISDSFDALKSLDSTGNILGIVVQARKSGVPTSNSDKRQRSWKSKLFLRLFTAGAIARNVSDQVWPRLSLPATSLLSPDSQLKQTPPSTGAGVAAAAKFK